MKTARIKRTLVLVTVASAALLGCELIVDFDRTKIPVEVSEAGPLDATTPVPTADAAVPDASEDASEDASDASNDATDDAADAADQ